MKNKREKTMEEKMTRKQEILNILFSVLLFGGLWGIVEATLGTLLHLPIVNRTMFLSSTTILVPIAFGLMGACYKRTNTFRCCFYMGILAASMKALSCLIFKMSFNPCYYILIESLAMGVAVLVIRPKQIISFAGLATVIIASTLYLAASTPLRINISGVTAAQFMDNIETYVFKFNCVAILYMFVTGAIIYGLLKLAEAREWNFSKAKDLIFHPAFAGSVAAVALAVTLILH